MAKTATTEVTKKAVDPVRGAITRVQRSLEPLNDDERVRVLRATGLAFGYDLALAPKPPFDTKA